MKYGTFSKDGFEFLIHDVATPSPWINYLYNDLYFSTISNNAGGISYFRNPLHGRITRYRINDVPPDRPGKYIYLRDLESGSYWSLSWQPCNRPKEHYQAAHGFGYTRIAAKVDDIQSEVTYFVPLDDHREIWLVRITNTGSALRKLAATGYVELALGHALIDQINQCDDQHFNRVKFLEKHRTLLATKTYWVTESMGSQQQENQEWDRWAYFTVSGAVDGYETRRERFLGVYRNEGNPQAVESNIFSSSDTDYGNAIAALNTTLTLEPGEERILIFSLGAVPKSISNSELDHTLQRYRTVSEVERALADRRSYWLEFFQNVRVSSPDTVADTFFNYWSAYQARVAFDVRRVASFYYWGISRGFGFRDTAQDILAVTNSDPATARERIRLLSRQMFRSGQVYHHFFNDGQGETTRHIDDPLWYILAVTDYVKETGDGIILDLEEIFVDAPESSVLDHMLAAVDFARSRLGNHGLPILGRGDWNDTLDYIGGENGGETVWGAMFYVAMLNRLLELLEFLNRDDLCPPIREFRDQLTTAVNSNCWDGEWYTRAISNDGRILGSHSNTAGRIFLNTQTWSIISGIASEERGNSALDSVKQFLDTDFGPKICAPAFREIDPAIGLITRCVPGKKENGAVFMHTTAWLIQAACMLRRGDEAYDYYRKLLPFNHDQDVYAAEPYVYSQYITSDEHESPGRASHSWQTGTAVWMYRIFADYILGVRSTYDGLTVDPVIPSHWQNIRVERLYRKTRYDIQINNPDGVQAGVQSITVNGRPIEGNVLPVCGTGTCAVVVTMG